MTAKISRRKRTGLVDWADAYPEAACLRRRREVVHLPVMSCGK